MNRQVVIKAEQIARMVVKGLLLTRIAIEMGMSYDGLLRITRQPEYLQIEERIRLDVTGLMDQRLAKRAAMDQKRQQVEDEAEDAVPEAMRVLIDQATKKRDLRAALALLDRDPRKQFTAQAKKADADAASPGAGLGTLPSEALAEVIKEADVTHRMMQTPLPDTSDATKTQA